MKRIDRWLVTAGLDPKSLRKMREAALHGADAGKDGPTRRGGVAVGPTLSADAPAPSGSGKGKSRSGEAPAKFNKGETTAAERQSGCVLRVPSGGRGRRTAKPPQGTFPRVPAVRRPLQLVIEGDHATSP